MTLNQLTKDLSVTNYYSQNGEDFILDLLFKKKEGGFFVEVGCIDGKRFSNTLCFEEKGWRGLCVEAHAGYIELLKLNRPNSIVCHCAVGEKDEEQVAFYANSRGSLSTLDRSLENYFKSAFEGYFTGFEKQIVQKRTLDSLFIEHSIENIDILSLDVEGYEVNVLKGLNLRKYRPQVLVIESDNAKHEKCIDQILLASGYVKSVRVASNIFYLGDKKKKRLIEDRVFEVELVHTRHPLDRGKNVHIKAVVDTRINSNNTFLRKIFVSILELMRDSAILRSKF